MSETSNPRFQEPIQAGPFRLRFPEETDLDQDEEWCEALVDGEWRRIRFHDYGRLYEVPGLYEAVIYRALRCNSPLVLSNLLAGILQEHGEDPERLRVFDIGAGNGMSGEALQHIGVRYVVGNDIVEEGKTATERDRSWAYDDYLVADLTNLSDEETTRLRRAELNGLAAMGALGFGDIPPAAFTTAYNLIADGGWLVFNINEGFLTQADPGGFAGLIRRMLEGGVMQMDLYKRYRHRIGIGGQPRYYIGAVARKLGPIPNDMVGV